MRCPVFSAYSKKEEPHFCGSKGEKVYEKLLNPQVVRTAEMMDMLCIVFVRGKRPEQAVIDLADSKGIVLLSTEKRLFLACGILYTHGLGG